MAVRYDKDDEVDNDLYHPIRLTKEQLHKYEADKEKSKTNPDSVFGDSIKGFANSRGRFMESLNEGDAEPK